MCSGCNLIAYCTFHKHANSKVQNLLSQLCFLLTSIIIIITITSNKPWNTKTHKTDRNPPITNHKPWPFEPVKVKFCFLRGPLRWLTAAKNAIVSWLLNFRIHMFVKNAVKYSTVKPCLIQTPHYNGQFALSLGKALVTFSKFNLLNMDTPLIQTISTVEYKVETLK